VTASDTAPSWRETLRRLTREASADTRRPDGPEGRVYAVPFARVWDEIDRLIAGRSRWKLEHRDEELGIFSVSCTTPVLRFVDDLTIWVSLDRHGLTRVEALSRSRVGSGDLGVNRRRIERLLRRLDEAVGPEHRLVDPAVRGRGTPFGGRPAE